MPDPIRSAGPVSIDNVVSGGTVGDSTVADIDATTGVRDVDAIDGTSRPDATGHADPAQVKAVKTLRKLIDSGKLQEYYDAAIGHGHADLKEQAIAFFDSLPTINAAASADELVALGLWTTAPRGIEQASKSARYLPGRQILVETNVNPELFDDAKFLSYKEDGPRHITHRARLLGESGDNFLVEVDGRSEPLEVPKQDIYKLNQPNHFQVKDSTGNVDPNRLKHPLGSDGLSKKVDYTDKFMKAKVCEAAIKMDELVGRLDFTKMSEPDPDGRATVWGRGAGASQMVALQQECVRAIHDVINMEYPGHGHGDDEQRSNTAECGRAAVKGWGHCDQQNSVLIGLLVPFQKSLAFDIKMFYGHCYRSFKRGDNPFNSRDPHSWSEITFRPSMQTVIYDRTWNQPGERPWYMGGGGDKKLTADIAYSRAGDRCPVRSWFDPAREKLTDTDVNMSGDISVQTFDRQFGVDGQDGRDHHQ